MEENKVIITDIDKKNINQIHELIDKLMQQKYDLYDEKEVLKNNYERLTTKIISKIRKMKKDWPTGEAVVQYVILDDFLKELGEL
jgi:hypothetical protein